MSSDVLRKLLIPLFPSSGNTYALQHNFDDTKLFLLYHIRSGFGSDLLYLLSDDHHLLLHSQRPCDFEDFCIHDHELWDISGDYYEQRDVLADYYGGKFREYMPLHQRQNTEGWDS